MPDPPPTPLRVVVVDDQPLLRSGLSMILAVEPDIEVVGEASDGRAAVELVERLRPDLVLMDVQMPVMDGIEATCEIVARDLAKVIILTTFDRDDYLVDAPARRGQRVPAQERRARAPRRRRPRRQ